MAERGGGGEDRASVEGHLEAEFGHADRAHYEWQTTHPVVSLEERRLVRAAFRPLGARVLDVGCGEGATLHHLGVGAGAVGVDLFEGKLAFARAAHPGCEFVAASVYELPFAAGRFDHVLVRDVIHHLDEPERAIAEIDRVLEPGGRVDVLEPCGYNPLIALHAATNRAERGELRSTPRFLAGLLAQRFGSVRVVRMQPLPLHRVVFHPRFGIAKLGASATARSAVRVAERLAGVLMPRASWAYIHVRATKPPGR